MKKIAVAVLFGLGLLSAILSSPVFAAGPADERFLIDQAETTLRAFQADSDMKFFREAMRSAKGALIIPALYKGGLGIGGASGKGVYMARDAKTGEWEGPVFYKITSGSLGIQAGMEVSEVIILAMTDEAAYKMLSSHFKLTSDAQAAAGMTGLGTSGNSTVPFAAYISFARPKGLYGGLNLEGSIAKPDEAANRAFYGENATAESILSRRMAQKHVSKLSKEMAQAVSASKKAID